MQKLNLLKTFLLSMLVITGCTRSQELGFQSEDPTLRGNEKKELFFKQANEMQNSIQIDGDVLLPDNRYHYEGNITIVGNLGSNIEVKAYGGQIHVKGNVGDGSTLRARYPVETKRHYALRPQPFETKSTPDLKAGDLLYPQHLDPAIIVDGIIRRDVKIKSNGSILISNMDETAEIDTRFGVVMVTNLYGGSPDTLKYN